MFGDPAQLPPVADKPLYHNKPTRALGEQGYPAYLMFSKVIKLSVNQRVPGSDLRQLTFKNFLRHLRNGDCTHEDWQLLLTRQPSKVQNLKDFQDAIRLFYGNNDVASFNYEQLSKLKQPIARIQAQHSSALAKTIKADEMCGLVPTLYLARNASVMLTLNLWPEVGLCNGATGKIIDIIYAANDFPPSLPISVIVQFDNYKDPSFVDTLPNIVPICPITITADTASGFHERLQIPLKLSWAITIHKSQGLTLPKAWINLGTSE